MHTRLRCFVVDSFADRGLSNETAHSNVEVILLICSAVFRMNSELNTRNLPHSLSVPPFFFLSLPSFPSHLPSPPLSFSHLHPHFRSLSTHTL